MSPISESCDNLIYDQACLKVFGTTHNILSLWEQSTECYSCDLLNWMNISGHKTMSFVFDSSTKYILEVRNISNNVVCNIDVISFKEHGTYGWNITDETCSDIYSISPSYSEYSALCFAVYALLLIFLVWNCAREFYINGFHFIPCRLWTRDDIRTEIESDLGTPAEGIRSDSVPLIRQNVRTRIMSLDAFRGLTIALMIFVNYGGGQYWFFEHAAWDGITFADFIFPWFAWIMGVSISMKMKSELRSGTSRKDLFYKVVLRSGTLIVFGIILTNIGNNDLRYIRLPGVLQRLGVSYFFTSSLETYFMNRQPSVQNIRLKFLEDVIECWLQWVIVLGMVAVHTFITFYMPVPGCPTGYIGPGGLYNHGMEYNCTGGASGYIDRLFFGIDHLYQRPSCQELYKCPIPYDPEGLLGTLTTVLCVYFGIQAGHTLLAYKSTNMRLKRWLSWSVITIILSGILCHNNIFGDSTIPLNKNLWSLSFVLLTSGSAFIMMAVLYFIIDHKKWWSGSPFYQAGMNAFLLYTLHILFRQTFPWQWKVFFNLTHTEYLLMDIWATFLWIFISVVLYHNQFFISI